MKNTKMICLYKESRRFDKENAVHVELRQWSRKIGSTNIVNTILISSAWVDGERIAYAEKCLTNKTNAEMIRVAINEFDELVENHPATYAVNEAQP